MTPSQIAVRDIFAEVLKLDDVDPDAGFLDLGGHSLLAVQVIALLRERHALQVSTLPFLENASATKVAASGRPLST